MYLPGEGTSNQQQNKMLNDFDHDEHVIIQVNRFSTKEKNGNHQISINATIKSKKYFGESLFFIMTLTKHFNSESQWRNMYAALFGNAKNPSPADCIGKTISFEIDVSEWKDSLFANPRNAREYVQAPPQTPTPTQAQRLPTAKRAPAATPAAAPIMSFESAGNAYQGEDEIPF